MAVTDTTRRTNTLCPPCGNQGGVTDERKPYEAPEVLDVERPAYPCPSCGASVVKLAEDQHVHVHPPCEQWAADHPEPEPA